MMVEEKVGALEAIAVRPATPESREALVAMYRSFEPKGAAMGLPPSTDERARRWLDSLAGFPNFLAWQDDRVVGHGVICLDGDAAEVAVFVAQENRGRGIGRRLLEALVAEARRLGLRRIWGVAEPDNIPMLRLARSCGFVPGRDLGEFYLDLASHSALPNSHLPAA